MTITAEDLHEHSSKGNAKRYWEGYRNMYGKDPEDRRHPDTIVGFLSKEKLHEMLINPNENPEMLLYDCGVALFYNEEVAFFADDGQYGYKVLPSDISACLIPKIQYNYGPGTRYPDPDALINIFFKGKRFLNTEQELLEYLNERNGVEDDIGFFGHPDDIY